MHIVKDAVVMYKIHEKSFDFKKFGIYIFF